MQTAASVILRKQGRNVPSHDFKVTFPVNIIEVLVDCFLLPIYYYN